MFEFDGVSRIIPKNTALLGSVSQYIWITSPLSNALVLVENVAVFN